MSTTNTPRAHIDLASLTAAAEGAAPGLGQVQEFDPAAESAPRLLLTRPDQSGIRVAIECSYEGRKSVIGGPDWQILEQRCVENGSFVATVNPTVIRALIAELELARQDDDLAVAQVRHYDYPGLVKNDVHQEIVCEASLPDGAKLFLRPDPELAALRSRINELEQRNRELESTLRAK